MTTLKAAEGVRHLAPLWSPDERYVYFSGNEVNGGEFYTYREDLNTGAVEIVWERAVASPLLRGRATPTNLRGGLRALICKARAGLRDEAYS